MITSQNGWPVFTQPSDKVGNVGLRPFIIPGVPGERLLLRDGCAGFVLVHFATWYNKHLQPITGNPLDDWGWAYRPIRGGASSSISNHSSGTAEDLNATQHSQGKRNTFTVPQVTAIHKRLKMYGDVIRWGGDYEHSLSDDMHFEINKNLTVTNALAVRLMGTPIGREVLKANPGLSGVITS